MASSSLGLEARLEGRLEGKLTEEMVGRVDMVVVVVVEVMVGDQVETLASSGEPGRDTWDGEVEGTVHGVGMGGQPGQSGLWSG